MLVQLAVKDFLKDVTHWKYLADDLPQPYRLWKAQGDRDMLEQLGTYLQQDIEAADAKVDELEDEVDTLEEAEDAESIGTVAPAATTPPARAVQALETPESASEASASEAVAGETEDEEDVATAEMEHWMKEDKKCHEMFMEALSQHNKWVRVKDRLPEASQEMKEFQTYCDGEFKRAFWAQGDDENDLFFWGMQEEDETR